MKKYILFTLKALFYAFVVALAATVFTSKFSDYFYGRTASSHLVPLWTKVQMISDSEGLSLSSYGFLEPGNVVPMQPRQFKDAFNGKDLVWMRFGPSNKTILYRSDKGSTAFTSEEWIDYSANGSSIEQGVLLPSEKAVRLDLEPHSLTIIATKALALMIFYVAIAFVGKFVIMVIVEEIKCRLEEQQEILLSKKMPST